MSDASYLSLFYCQTCHKGCFMTRFICSIQLFHLQNIPFIRSISLTLQREKAYVTMLPHVFPQYINVIKCVSIKVEMVGCDWLIIRIMQSWNAIQANMKDISYLYTVTINMYVVVKCAVYVTTCQK